MNREKKTRFSNLNTELIPLGDGENPPAGKINPDYCQQPSNPRNCLLCLKSHDHFIENVYTGMREHEIDVCPKCFWKSVMDSYNEFRQSNQLGE